MRERNDSSGSSMSRDMNSDVFPGLGAKFGLEYSNHLTG
jgi:hypothetical protein